MTLTEAIDYIEDQWPDISDANSCARWIIKETGNGGLYADGALLDKFCCYWFRKQAYL